MTFDVYSTLENYAILLGHIETALNDTANHLKEWDAKPTAYGECYGSGLP